MSEQIEKIPDEALALIDVSQYEEQTEFDIEMGYVLTSCASVQNGNPLFWDKDVARQLTHGQIAPPTMMSVWFRPHHWAPGAEGERKALQSHFDLKEIMGLPEAIIGGNELVFGVPVRVGDVLTTRQIVRSISEPKTTRVGKGRFWNIDVEVVNQNGEHVGTETYSCFGYRRPQS
jgi:acyl dehydratase